MNVAIAQQLRDDPYPAGHPAFSVWVTKIRVHPDHPDRPGISVMVRRWRAAPNSRPRSVAELRRMGY